MILNLDLQREREREIVSDGDDDETLQWDGYLKNTQGQLKQSSESLDLRPFVVKDESSMGHQDTHKSHFLGVKGNKKIACSLFFCFVFEKKLIIQLKET